MKHTHSHTYNVKFTHTFSPIQTENLNNDNTNNYNNFSHYQPQSVFRKTHNHPVACSDVISPFILCLLAFSEFQLFNSAFHSVLCELYKWTRMVCCWLDVSVSDWQLISPPAIPYHGCTELKGYRQAERLMRHCFTFKQKKRKHLGTFCYYNVQCASGSWPFGFWISLSFNVRH